MIVEHLEVVDFRNYRNASVDLTGGTTLLSGDNGHGKTNFVEALAYLATLTSFRAASSDTLVRQGCDSAVIRATIRHDDGRNELIETQIAPSGRNRVQVNRQRLSRARDLLGTLRVTVFSPDDLLIVKGGPADRRSFLDDTLVALAPKYDAVRLELDRIVRQRNTLLKQSGLKQSGLKQSGLKQTRSPSSATDSRDEIGPTLDVWDAKFASIADQFGHARATLVARLEPMVNEAYEQLAARPVAVDVRYEPPWRSSGLAVALAEARAVDLRRGVTTVGPHRDELALSINGRPSRTHASQGEQRSLALALRLAGHRLVTERTGSSPVLVLDDVLSELDDQRSSSLLAHLPAGQIVITSATNIPETAHVDRVLHVRNGVITGSC